MCVLCWQIDTDNNPVDEEREARLFPEPNSDAKILCHDVTAQFLIYGTDVSLDYTYTNSYTLTLYTYCRHLLYTLTLYTYTIYLLYTLTLYTYFIHLLYILTLYTYSIHLLYTLTPYCIP